MSATIRPATPQDADALAANVAAGFATYHDFAPEGWEPPDRLELALGLVARLQERTLKGWVAEDEHGAVVGHVTYLPASHSRIGSDDPGLAHLEQLFVQPSQFGTGLARTLMATCVADAAAAGYTRIRLGTPRDHVRARRFYEREGWTTDGVPLEDDMLGLVLIEYHRALAGSGSRATA